MKVIVRQRGTIVIPKELRDAVGIESNDVLEIIRLGNGLMLLPSESLVERALEKLQRMMEKDHVRIEDLLVYADRVRHEET